MLDYPFLRTNSEFALLGFSFALVILVGLSLVLPAFITKNVADRYSDRLADEVKSRTSDLQEANTHLKAVTAENKYLLSVVCHDLATPLATVVMGMDLLSETMEEEAKTTLGFDYIKRIRKALKSIEEILSYARDMQAMRTGKKKVSLEQVDLAGVVNESVSSLSEELGRKAINLKVENRSPESRVLADVSTLRNQVMNNLLSTAIKFSHPNGDIKLVIQETGDRVFLSVTDTGIGMPQDLASRVFSLSGVTNRLGTAGEKGTGFGLPIVKACLEQYGAEIRCESRSQAEYPDQHGTTFTVSFRKVIPSSVPSGVVA